MSDRSNMPPAPPHQRRPGASSGSADEVAQEIRQQEARPWSEDELLTEMQRVEAVLDDEVVLLKSLGVSKAQATHTHDLEQARQTLVVKRDHKDMSSDKLREAWVTANTNVSDLKLEADLAATLYWDQATTIKARMAQVDILRSMMRSIRDRTERWGGDERRHRR